MSTTTTTVETYPTFAENTLDCNYCGEKSKPLAYHEGTYERYCESCWDELTASFMAEDGHGLDAYNHVA